jgi:broad specificity phosphatase PhoE
MDPQPPEAEQPAPAVPGGTVVHLLRHGEVDNPRQVLYGRLPGYHLSDLGRRMAERAAAYFAGRDVNLLVSSPMERAQETAVAVAEKLGLVTGTDPRLTEGGNLFEGLTVGAGDGLLRHPEMWRHLRNPFRPSWGEPYRDVADRMAAAVETARREAAGHEAVLVSHQLPIWVARLAAQHRHLWHNPRHRQCSLASVTSFGYDPDGALLSIGYTEPSADLLPGSPGVAGA